MRTLIAIIAAGALAALPATAVAKKPDSPGKSQEAKSKDKAKGKSKRCAKTPKVGFTVQGTLVSYTADDPATPANEGTISITVTGANSHAANSGEIADQDAAKPGMQVAGATYSVPATDAFKVELVGFEGADTPSPGDAVKLSGKVARTKAKCAAAGTSTADRYGAVDVRKVTITDSDPDA